MSSSTKPPDEAQRLQRLRELLVLDSPPEPLFDSIAGMASAICGAPIALLSLVDAERQWFKANVGLPGVNETPRDVAFCAHAIHEDTLFEVPDAQHDGRFAHNPLVAGAPDIRFYAGAPLRLSDGARIGTLCVIDRQARRLTPEQGQQLQALAHIAAQALEMRHQLIDRSLAVRSEHEAALVDSEARHRAILDAQSELVSQARPDGTLIYVNPAYAAHFGRTVVAILGTSLFDYVEPDDQPAVRERVGWVLGTGESLIGENRMTAPSGDERWFAWTNTRQFDAQGLPLLHSVGRDISARKRAEQKLRENEAFLRRIGQVAGVGGWQLELSSGTLTWSEQTKAIHEVPANHVPTLTEAIQFYASEVRPVIESAVQAALACGAPWDLELPLTTAKGRPIWVRAQGEAEFEYGAPVRLVGAFQDITERKLLEQRVAEDQRFLRLLTDSLPQRIGYLDRTLRYRFVNEAHMRRFGTSREHILGRTRDEVTGVPVPHELADRFALALAGQAQSFEFDEPGADGVRRKDCQLLPDRGEDGQIRGFFSATSDITERSRAEQALRELTAIIENSTDCVVQTDWRGSITYLNPAVRRVLGMAPDAPLSGLNFAQFNTAATNRHFAEVIVPAVKATGAWVGETTVLAAGACELPVSHMVIAHRDAAGRVARYSAVMRDISEATMARRELQLQSATLRAVSEAVPAIVAVVGADMRYRFVNSGFERWMGRPRDQIVGRTIAEMLSPAELDRSKLWIDRVMGGQTVQFERFSEHRGIASTLAMTYTPLLGDGGRIEGFIGVGLDITAHRQEQARLQDLSERDALTGLLNRSGFTRCLVREVAEARGAELALLYVDLDRFKPVNDQHGHPVGDQLLRLVAQRLLSLVRPTDAVARLGGDEFALLLLGARAPANAEAVAGKVVQAMGEAFNVGGLDLRIGASVGVAYGVDPATGVDGLLARADAMLYRAKNHGRGRYAGESSPAA